MDRKEVTINKAWFAAFLFISNLLTPVPFHRHAMLLIAITAALTGLKFMGNAVPIIY